MSLQHPDRFGWAIARTEWLFIVVQTIARDRGAVLTRMSFAFVFVTFGLQKVIVPGSSPVDEPIMALASAVGLGAIVPLAWTPTIVGLYEVTLGVWFLVNRLKAALVLFVPHQLVSFSTILLIPSFVFDDPMPFAYDQFGAFMLKNIIFVGAFLLLLAHAGDFDDGTAT
ncbi:MAG: hypothetical protein ACLFMX_00925 [Halobacteriales archaeon]